MELTLRSATPTARDRAGEAAQANMQLPAAAIQAFQGMLLFFLLAVDVLTNFRLRFGKGEVA